MKTTEVHHLFKKRFGYTEHPNIDLFKSWAQKEKFSLKTLFPTINKTEAHHLDLSVHSNFINGKDDFNNLTFFEGKIMDLQKTIPNKIIAGGYLEKRALYTSSIYERKTTEGTEKRNTHLGLDFWLPENTPVHAILDGEVVCTSDDSYHKGYGGLLILKHQLKHFHFYTLYGHNTIKSVLKHRIGSFVKKGDEIAVLANATENGDWVPHLHFQVMLTLLDYTNDFPGVTFESELEIWKSICPNPNLLFKLPNL
ncbi:peptidoglycan DD-metalloendopeptidase family protein [Polaribacter tangerinus]|uniref:peptidoglycan DD-metalloendopeptidase family protein n=1 Tax=Polaribacter tangerinus TaxID=1920034 RepID=UPI000B4B9010|nr:peptidoglycan DD-metalloendopeptidase family protein [Polaribacter tangerinus]